MNDWIPTRNKPWKVQLTQEAASISCFHATYGKSKVGPIHSCKPAAHRLKDPAIISFTSSKLNLLGSESSGTTKANLALDPWEFCPCEVASVLPQWSFSIKWYPYSFTQSFYSNIMLYPYYNDSSTNMFSNCMRIISSVPVWHSCQLRPTHLVIRMETWISIAGNETQW